MALRDVLQMIQQQQALKYQKEKDAQSLALNLLAMEQRKTDRAQEILVREYYDAKKGVEKTEAMFDAYTNLSPSDVSQGGRDIISIVDEQNNISMEAVTQNLNTLSSYQSELESSLGKLGGQAQTLKEIQSQFAGANRVLEEHEYRDFQEHALKPIDEGGLGWATTAGADKAFYATDPTSRYLKAVQVTEHMQKEHDVGAKGSYTILQNMLSAGEDEDTDDIIERLSYEDVATGKTVEPPEGIVTALQRMAIQTDYDDFVTNLNTIPEEAGGDILRGFLQTHPNTSTIFSNLTRDYDAIKALDTELAGINETPQATDLENFVSSVEGVTDKNVLFGLFDQAVAGKSPEEHDPFFNIIEAQIGEGDVSKDYMQYRGLATDDLEQSLNELKIQAMTGEELFPGELPLEYRGMDYELSYDYDELKGGISQEQHVQNQIDAIKGSEVFVDVEIFGDESRVVDAKADSDGRIMIKIDPDIGPHVARWTQGGKPIYLDEVTVSSKGRSPEGMPTAFDAGPIGYYWDPMDNEYKIKKSL